MVLLVTVGCVPVYLNPSEGKLAFVKIINRTSGMVNPRITENNHDCRGMKKIEWSSTGIAKFNVVRGSEYSLKLSWVGGVNQTGLGLSVATCSVIVTLPFEKENYELVGEFVDGRCGVKVFYLNKGNEWLPGNRGRLRDVTQPFAESGPWCRPDST